jgi:hypothetical protein
LLLELREFNSLEDLLDTQLKEFNLPGLDALVVKHKVIVKSMVTFLTLNDSAFEEALRSGAWPNQLRSDLATVSAIDDNSLIAEIV